MEEAFLAFISSFGYLAVLALILLENIFPPIPSELILPMAGFLVHDTSMELPGVIIFATAGSVLGAFILYGIGRLLSRERLMAFFDTKPMRLLGFKGDDISKAIGWFDRKGQATVLICRCIPVVAALFLFLPAPQRWPFHALRFTPLLDRLFGIPFFARWVMPWAPPGIRLQLRLNGSLTL